MLSFTATLERFNEQGEKTGWTFITVPEVIAQQLKPGNKKSFRVKGLLDQIPFEGLAIMPMGDGSFILPLNAALRKALRKTRGDKAMVQLEADAAEFRPNQDLMDCLADEPEALAFFDSFSPGTQRYYSNWVNEAKTEATKAKRIAQCVSALARRLDYGTMIREGKKNRDLMR